MRVNDRAVVSLYLLQATPNLRWSGPLGDKVPGARQGNVQFSSAGLRVMRLRAAAQLGR
jgi:hypothetical protein